MIMLATEQMQNQNKFTGLFLQDANNRTELEELAETMKNAIMLEQCEYAKKTPRLFASRWACKRKKQARDLCRQDSTNEQKCVEWLVKYCKIKNYQAEDLLVLMEKQGLIRVYRCTAVFFL